MAVGRKVLFGYAVIRIDKEPHGIYAKVYISERFLFYIKIYSL